MADEALLTEPFARQIMRQALAQDRCADVLNCLLGGGSVTLEAGGRIALATADQLYELWNRPPDGGAK